MGDALIELIGLVKEYRQPGRSVTALSGIDLAIEAGSLVAVTGPSGSGKTTLLNILAGFDRATAGTYRFAGADLTGLDEDGLAGWRGENLAMVFQEYRLMPNLDVYENMALAALCQGRRPDRAAIMAALAQVGIEDLAAAAVSQLSGGQKQRVAIARAVAARPRVVLADEPTGALDEANGQAVMGLLAGLAEQGVTVIAVTHDESNAIKADRRIQLEQGRLAADDGLLRSAPAVAQPASAAARRRRCLVFDDDGQ